MGNAGNSLDGQTQSSASQNEDGKDWYDSGDENCFWLCDSFFSLKSVY